MVILTTNKAEIQQHHRLATKTVCNLYSIVTDGVTFQFLRLNNSLRLQISVPFVKLDERGRKLVQENPTK